MARSKNSKKSKSDNYEKDDKELAGVDGDSDMNNDTSSTKKGDIDKDSKPSQKEEDDENIANETKKAVVKVVEPTNVGDEKASHVKPTASAIAPNPDDDDIAKKLNAISDADEKGEMIEGSPVDENLMFPRLNCSWNRRQVDFVGTLTGKYTTDAFLLENGDMDDIIEGNQWKFANIEVDRASREEMFLAYARVVPPHCIKQPEVDDDGIVVRPLPFEAVPSQRNARNRRLEFIACVPSVANTSAIKTNPFGVSLGHKLVEGVMSDGRYQLHLQGLKSYDFSLMDAPEYMQCVGNTRAFDGRYAGIRPTPDRIAINSVICRNERWCELDTTCLMANLVCTSAGESIRNQSRDACNRIITMAPISTVYQNSLETNLKLSKPVKMQLATTSPTVAATLITSLSRYFASGAGGCIEPVSTPVDQVSKLVKDGVGAAFAIALIPRIFFRDLSCWRDTVNLAFAYALNGNSTVSSLFDIGGTLKNRASLAALKNASFATMVKDFCDQSRFDQYWVKTVNHPVKGKYRGEGHEMYVPFRFRGPVPFPTNIGFEQREITAVMASTGTCPLTDGSLMARYMQSKGNDRQGDPTLLMQSRLREMCAGMWYLQMKSLYSMDVIPPYKNNIEKFEILRLSISGMASVCLQPTALINFAAMSNYTPFDPEEANVDYIAYEILLRLIYKYQSKVLNARPGVAMDWCATILAIMKRLFTGFDMPLQNILTLMLFSARDSQFNALISRGVNEILPEISLTDDELDTVIRSMMPSRYDVFMGPMLSRRPATLDICNERLGLWNVGQLPKSAYPFYPQYAGENDIYVNGNLAKRDIHRIMETRFRGCKGKKLVLKNLRCRVEFEERNQDDTVIDNMPPLEFKLSHTTGTWKIKSTPIKIPYASTTTWEDEKLDIIATEDWHIAHTPVFLPYDEVLGKCETKKKDDDKDDDDTAPKALKIVDKGKEDKYKDATGGVKAVTANHGAIVTTPTRKYYGLSTAPSWNKFECINGGFSIMARPLICANMPTCRPFSVLDMTKPPCNIDLDK